MFFQELTVTNFLLRLCMRAYSKQYDKIKRHFSYSHEIFHYFYISKTIGI